MKVLIDTCVVIDFLQKREPFAQDALRIFHMAAMQRFNAFITAKASTDVFYLSHRNTHSNDESRRILQDLLLIVSLADTTAEDVQAALYAGIGDFEDAVMIETAKRIGADCIITRNARHYTGSAVPVYEPKAFLAVFED